MFSFFIVTHLNSKFQVYQGCIQKVLNFHKANVNERLLYTHEVSHMLLKYIHGWIHQSTNKNTNKDSWIWVESFLNWAEVTLDAVLLHNSCVAFLYKPFMGAEVSVSAVM